MTSDKLSSLTRTAPVLSLLLVATILFVGPLATVQQTASSTTALTDEEEDVLETQDTATENLTEEDRDVNGLEFTPRWGDISTLEPDSIDVLFADCLEDEFAVSSQFVFETSDVIASQSFPVAFEDDDDETAMSWLAVVENTHGTEDKAASIGVICASENGGDDDDDDNDGNIDVSTKTTIKNIIKNFIRVENNEIVNLNNIINIRQQIIQNAMQILSITGNNNTVSQVINQAATQIANVNATTPTEIQQIIDQNAQQQGVISGTGNQTSLSQLIEQDAAQQADVTEGGEEGGATDIDQAIGQDAEQAANVTEGGEEGGATDIDQAIGQDAEQAANVTEGGEEGGATDIDQAIGQDAEQAANVTEGGEEGGAAGTSVEQLIQERAQQQAQVDEQQQQQQQQPVEGGATDIDQAIGQNASQQAQVDDEGEVP
jgi:hypothetical protein